MVLHASGVSPCGTCQRMSPVSRLMALMRPSGGLTIGSPWTWMPLMLPPCALVVADPTRRCGARRSAPCPGDTARRVRRPRAAAPVRAAPPGSASARRGCVSRDRGAAGPVGRGALGGHGQRGNRTLGLAHDGRREDRADAVPLDRLHGFGAQLGGEVNQVVHRQPLPVVHHGPGGKGLRGQYFSPGTSPSGTGRSSIGQIGWPVTRSKT